MKVAKAILTSAIVVSLGLCLCTPALAGGSAPKCETRYPVVLAHGMGATSSILGIVDYWWGIPDALEDEGADVFVTKVNAMDGTQEKAEDFNAQVLEILAVTGKNKVNIIGHSHGTIYSRLAISNMDLDDKVASHTSIAGPHRGSAVADVVMYDLPGWLVDLGGDALDFIYAFVFGDSDPDCLDNGWDLTTDYMIDDFNPNTPNVGGIYYQSWAGKIKTMAIDARNWYFIATWPIMSYYEGDNDGVVSVSSAKWGTFRGVEKGSWYSAGVDHVNLVGHLFGFTPGWDAPEFYVDIVEELADKGY